MLFRNANPEEKENAASLKVTLSDFGGVAQTWYYIIMSTNGFDGTIIGELSPTGNYGGQLMVSDAGIKYRKLSGGTYREWNNLITNADYNVQSFTNQYGLNLHLIKFGNDNLKVIRLSGYINKALTAGTEYIIASNVSLKSRVDWYHNVFVSGKGSELTVYLNIDNDGNVKITPKTAIASGTAINMMEYYV